MGKHTKGLWKTRDMGPWSLDSDRGSFSAWAVGTSKDVVAIAVTHKHYTHPELDANANLLAAAPELLEALEGLLSRFEGSQPLDLMWKKEARAAIAKAKGETK